jgi:hypothetical protein
MGWGLMKRIYTERDREERRRLNYSQGSKKEVGRMED